MNLPSPGRGRRSAFPCLGPHALDAWQLRPPQIGTRVEWLYRQSQCSRCGTIERRWFKVEVPAWFTPPRPGRAITVDQYLKRLKVTPPPPDALLPGTPEEMKHQLGLDT